MGRDGLCWRVYYRGRGCPYRLLLGFLDAPDESGARVRAWHLWDGLEPVRLEVRQAGVCAVSTDAGAPGGG